MSLEQLHKWTWQYNLTENLKTQIYGSIVFTYTVLNIFIPTRYATSLHTYIPTISPASVSRGVNLDA